MIVLILQQSHQGLIFISFEINNSDIKSVTSIQINAGQSLLQIEGVQVIESHQVAISPEDVHVVFVDHHTLAVPGTGLLTDDKATRLIIHYFLLQLFLGYFLVPDRLQCLHHGFCGGRQRPVLTVLTWLLAELFKQLFFLL